MRLGDVVSVLSEGLYNGFQISESTPTLPGPKVTVTLLELTETKDSTGGRVTAYTTVQDMSGSLQPLRANEVSLYEKQSVVANYAFYVSNSVFTSSTNEAKLVERNRIQYLGINYNITFVENRTEGMSPHYKILLEKII